MCFCRSVRDRSYAQRSVRLRVGIAEARHDWRHWRHPGSAAGGDATRPVTKAAPPRCYLGHTARAKRIREHWVTEDSGSLRNDLLASRFLQQSEVISTNLLFNFKLHLNGKINAVYHEFCAIVFNEQSGWQPALLASLTPSSAHSSHNPARCLLKQTEHRTRKLALEHFILCHEERWQFIFND